MKVLFAWSSAGTYFFIIIENLDDKAKVNRSKEIVR